MNGNGHPPHRVRFSDEGMFAGLGYHGPEAILLSAFQLILAGVALVCFSGLNIILMVLYVTVRPFSLPAYRRLSAQVGAESFLDALALLLPNTRLHLTSDSDVPSPVGTSLLVCNHIFHADWWVLLMLGRCVGLRGSLKFFLRNEYLNVKSRQNVSVASSPSNNGNSGDYFLTSTNSRIFSLPNSSSNSTFNTGNVSTATNGHHANHSKPEAPLDLAIVAKILHFLLDFPLLNEDEYISDRQHLFQLLRSFNEGSNSPVHLLFFPECWSMYNGADRKSLLAKCNVFARREGRPQMKHLLLPRTRGFNASLECLRESSPVVYDVTVAYEGYNGSLPPHMKLSLFSLWRFLFDERFPRDIHVRIKRYSMEEVLQDSSWLDKKWAEKDRLLSYFARHQCFTNDTRGYGRKRVFETRNHSIESSIVNLARLLLVPCAVPLILVLSIPFFWAVLCIWLLTKVYAMIFSDSHISGSDEAAVNSSHITPSSTSANTPSFPVTPFGSPSVGNWRDLLKR